MSPAPKQPKAKIIFFGNESIATGISTDTPVLRSLVSCGYEISLIIASQHNTAMRDKKEPKIIETARQYNIPLITPDNLNSVSDQIQALEPSIGILIAYGKIIPESIIKLFRYGIINIHPSLLPQYRGSTPIEQAILDGQTTTGVTIMQLTKELDAGPILVQSQIFMEKLSKQDLAERLLVVGNQILQDVLPKILSGNINKSDQENSQATYTKLITKADGKLDKDKTATQLSREVRAYWGWPGSYFVYQDSNVTVLEASESSVIATPGELAINNKKLYFGCHNGSIEIIRLQKANKKAISARDFINSHQEIKRL